MPERTPLKRRHVWLAVPNWLFELIGRRVKTGVEAATLDRFFASRHVGDLRAIIIIALGGVMAIFSIGLVLAVESELQKRVHIRLDQSNWSDWVKAIGAALRHPHLWFSAGANFLTFFGPVLAIFGGIVAWAYQAGSSRLGVVDLFACEISTLCRVATVLDTVPYLLKRIDHRPVPAAGSAPAASSSEFTSQEEYFPVFANNTKDLQALEARVVVNITAFYTYMKAVRDAMRGLPAKVASADDWHQAWRDTIYLLYLGLESGRKAIADLVEFEPEEAERTIVVLISELVAYLFLRCAFHDPSDMRCKRLILRESEYAASVTDLRCRVERGWSGDRKHEWEPAWLLLPELRWRYAAAMEIAKTGSATAESSRLALPV